MEKERIPKETETIAARRAARVAEKIRKAGRLRPGRAWWSNSLVEGVALLVLFLLNFYLVYKFFDFPAPDTTFSGPTIPLMAKLLEFFGVPLPYSIQYVNLSFFLAFPITFYLFIRKVTERKLAALLAVLFATLPIYPLAKVRIQIAFVGIEGPHVASLTAIPLAIFGVLSFIREGGMKNLAIAAGSSALVALISPFGFLVYAIFAVISAFSEMLLGRARVKLVRFIVSFFFAATLVSFWYNPAFFYWMITGPLGEEIRQMATKLIPISFFTLPILGAFGYLLFDRKPDLQSVFLATFYSISFGMIVLVGGGFVPSHPSRYLSEFGMSLAFLAGVGIVGMLDLLKFRKKRILAFIGNKALSFYILFVLVLALVFFILIKRDGITLDSESILGLWIGVEHGEIWAAKDKGGILSYSGYLITGLSALSLFVIGIKNRLWK